MKTMLGSLLLAGGLGLAAAAAAQDVAVSKMAFMTFKGDVMIQAAPAAVWSALTDADKAQSWCPLWKDAKTTTPLTRVGATIGFANEFGDVGKSVVLYVDPERELRIAHVPDNGSYACQTSMVLTPKEGWTLVHVTEQYSDAMDAPLDAGAAADTKAEIEGTMKALKDLAEHGMPQGKAK